MGILGGKYLPAGQLFNFLGLAVGTTTDNARADVSGGGLTAPFSQLFNLKTPNSVTFPPNVINAVTITFKPSTGLFTGSFKQGTSLRKASIAGVLVRTADGNTAEGFGYFLLPQEPLAPETTAKSTILSGKVPSLAAAMTSWLPRLALPAAYTPGTQVEVSSSHLMQPSSSPKLHPRDSARSER